MLRKKIYIPIGLCLVLLLAIGFLSLRSDVPTEPVKIYKVTTPDTPAKVTKTAKTETATSAETIGGHFHADGTWHNQIINFHKREMLPMKQCPDCKATGILALNGLFGCPDCSHYFR